MHLKKKLTAAAVALILYSSGSSASGIPVVDAVGNLQELNHWMERVVQWEKTALHFENQMNAYKEQLATATGIRDVQMFISQSKGLATDLKGLQQRGISLDGLLSNPNGVYTSELNGLYGKYKVFDSCNKTGSDTYLASCKQMVLNQAAAVEETTEVQNKINDALNDISELSSRIQLSKDSKESQDLANVVAAKSVQLNALTTQWEISVKQAEQRNKLLEVQRQKTFSQRELNAPVADLNNIGY